ncbi:hypothetical protein D0863_09548 [Hortaea werneckii]|uniref:Glycosyltransferase family 34 protein n=1 Tax=Hortaea werneckii TaxID=91943 RepID=A0A3M7DLH7_HORWE|nr:hypothetical protein D0863_09548 [Hortaea werneckii]
MLAGVLLDLDADIKTAIRNIAILATLVVALFLLLHSFSIGPTEIEHTTRESLQAINNFAPASWRAPRAKVTKVTALFGEENEIYEAAIRTHDEHNRLHGYEMKVLREKVVSSFWSKPAYLLATLVDELAKPAEVRTEWIMWTGPDIILLNPQIPLEVFLPPQDLDDQVHFIGTHDHHGLNTGVFFLRVHEWSVKMLIEVLATPKSSPAVLEHAYEKDKAVLEEVLTHPDWREYVLYQPRPWWNAYQLDATEYESGRGALLVHFHGLEGDKWSSMSHYLEEVGSSNSTWSVPLAMTNYEGEVSDYWARLRQAGRLLDQAERNLREEGVEEAALHLVDIAQYEADMEGEMHDAMDGLKAAMGITEGEKVI